uniref:Aquaporin n=1 Tax=Ditylenchus dipsaci TaxID=166011 RepID=A0A915EJI1_9BILA
MYAFRAADFFPAIICIAYYAVVLFLAEISRKLVDVTLKKKNGLLYVFLIELIGTAQQATCVYENGVMIKNYGVWGFFLTVASLLLAIGGIINRGAFISPLAPIEMYTQGKINTEKLMVLLLAQTIGGLSAFRFANTLWYYSLNYSNDHMAFYERLPCAIVYKVSFLYAFLFEIFATFLFRCILHRLPTSYKNYMAPIVVAGFLSIALAFIGVPGLNPVTASSRLQGCPGLDLQWFIMTYWCCPVVGWLLATYFDRKPKQHPSSPTKAKKKKN